MQASGQIAMPNHYIADWATRLGKRQIDFVNGLDADKSVVSRWFSGAMPSPANMQTIAAFLGVSVADLFAAPPEAQAPSVRMAEVQLPARDRMPRNIPVFGTVAGSMNGRGAFQLTSDEVDYVARPPGIANARDIYGLYVEGDSMLPMFRPGDLVLVNPHKPVRVDDVVIIQEPDTDNGRPCAFIKIFRRRSTRGIVAQQLNPPSEIEFIRPGTIMHKVLTMNELFGV